MKQPRSLLALVLPALMLLLAGCTGDGLVDSESAVQLSESASAPGVASATASITAVDPFADAVAEDGVVDGGQGFIDPAGGLGNLQVLDPAKSPPVVGLGIGGYAVYDMGEAILDGPGFDFMIVEADGSLIGAGFGVEEPSAVGVSNSPTGPFVSLGGALGNGFFDLDGSGLASARYVRIDDDGGFPPSGVDIQGIVAFHFEGANLNIAPQTLSRSSRSGDVRGILQLPAGFSAAAASIVLIAGIDQPSPTPAPYISTLDIPGTLAGSGNIVTFDKTAVLDEAEDGDDTVVAVKVTSTSGEVLYLFHLINIRS